MGKDCLSGGIEVEIRERHEHYSRESAQAIYAMLNLKSGEYLREVRRPQLWTGSSLSTPSAVIVAHPACVNSDEVRSQR